MIKNLWEKFFKRIATEQAPEPSTLDTMGIVILCPPSHGARCTCTWY